MSNRNTIQVATHIHHVFKNCLLSCARFTIYYTLAHSMFHRPLKFAFFVLLYVFFPSSSKYRYLPVYLIQLACSLCIIDTGNCVPGKRENNDGSHTRGGNFIIYSCLYLYYVVKELYANL
jgi:hypothetical protein